MKHRLSPQMSGSFLCHLHKRFRGFEFTPARSSKAGKSETFPFDRSFSGIWNAHSKENKWITQQFECVYGRLTLPIIGVGVEPYYGKLADCSMGTNFWISCWQESQVHLSEWEKTIFYTPDSSNLLSFGSAWPQVRHT